MVTNLADYKTFSMMMRMRVEQKRWMKMMQEAFERARAAQGDDGDGEGGAGHNAFQLLLGGPGGEGIEIIEEVEDGGGEGKAAAD